MPEPPENLNRVAVLDRVPPQNLEAEQCVLGCMMLDKGAARQALELLAPGDFYREAHGRLFRAFQVTYEKYGDADLILAADWLRNRTFTAANGETMPMIDSVGGIAYLDTLMNMVPTAANAEHYAGIVAEKSRLRRLIGASHDLAKIAGKGDPEEAASIAIPLAERIIKDFEPQKKEARETNRDALARIYAEVAQRQEDQTVIGIGSAFPSFNARFGGYLGYNTVGAITSAGKTAFALSECYHIARRHRVLYVSLEQSEDQLIYRLMGIHVQKSPLELQRKVLAEEEQTRWAKAYGLMCSNKGIFPPENVKDHGLEILYRPGLTTAEFERIVRERHRNGGIDFVVCDYLNLLVAPNVRADQMTASMREKTQALFRCTEYATLLVLSQFNREIGKRKGEDGDEARPQVSDLLDSGSQEQASDRVLFLHRPSRREECDLDDDAELIVAKNRHGATGTIPLWFHRANMYFTEPREDLLSKRDYLLSSEARKLRKRSEEMDF